MRKLPVVLIRRNPLGLPKTPNQWLLSARPAPLEGRSRSSRTWGGMRWTRQLRKTSVAKADGEVVWSWRPDAGVKSAEVIPPATVAKEPGHRGEHVISRSGAIRAAGSRTCIQLSSSGSTGRSSIPEASAMESRGRSVLDTPHPRGMTNLYGATGCAKRRTPTVIVRLGRTIQYSRSVSDGIEKPRRTGYPLSRV